MAPQRLTALVPISLVGAIPAFSGAMSTKYQFNKESLISIIEELSRLSWNEIQKPEGQQARLWRRVSIWVFYSHLEMPIGELQSVFNIGAKQSVYRVLTTKQVGEDEYNWRKHILRRCEQNLKQAA